MDKVAEFYTRWFAKKRAADCSAAEAASEEFRPTPLIFDLQQYGTFRYEKKVLSWALCILYSNRAFASTEPCWSTYEQRERRRPGAFA
jgi:hypothetical protein